MPVYNGERHLVEAIDSVLAQTFRDFEFLIVDDGSTDGSAAIVASYSDPRIRMVVNERNLGLPAALNRGLSLARGDLVARQDMDDLSVRNRLERQMQVLSRHPDVALLGTQGYAIDERGRYVGRIDRSLTHPSIRWYDLVDNPFIHTSVMFRRAVVWDAMGGFDESLSPFCQDYELWSRIMRAHLVRNLPDRLVAYRLRSSSITEESRTNDGYRPEFAEIVRLLVRRNLKAAFGDDVVSDADADLMSKFVLGIDASLLGRFLGVFERFLEEYGRLHPEVVRSSDFRRTLARQYDAVAFRVRPSSRTVAVRVYARGIRRDPAMAGWISWPRALALAIFGKQGRARFALLKKYSRLLPAFM